MPGRILIVEDDADMLQTLEKSLGRRGFTTRGFRRADEALRALDEGVPVDIVLTDINMPGMSGMALCERITLNRPHIPVVVVTGFGSLDTAVSAIRAGAYDFVTKPFDMDQLVLVMERALQHRFLQEEVKRLRQKVERGGGVSAAPDDFVGESSAMKDLFNLVERVADSESTILITGESGTGKEVVARAIHAQSPRRSGPFVPINCAAVPEHLLESELFGHVRGAFTDARTTRSGLFVEANGGVIFLDEIGELPLSLQPKLLRALQERKVRPVGATSELPFDARVVAATNRDLELAVEEGRFREDLYFRINVINIELPPLRARGNDVLVLAQRFVEHFAERSRKQVKGLSPQAAQKLLAYSWPGNVRELQNVIERAVALTRFELVSVDDLPEKIQSYRDSRVLPEGDDPAGFITLEELERRYIHKVLDALGGSRTLAARTLGIDRKTLYRKLREEEGRE
ncbi:MAG: sigma-54-dependent Fis family transcriptional regulator [Myxococcaceae bacterium]|nr:sigma-54-dependent Fis family transcriptional regulator [Myxococcaceae bacterium]